MIATRPEKADEMPRGNKSTQSVFLKASPEKGKSEHHDQPLEVDRLVHSVDIEFLTPLAAGK